MEDVMARLRGNVLGQLRGTLGNFYAREIDGETFLSSRAASYHLPVDPDSIVKRKQFAVTGRFAKLVNSLPVLKTVWKHTAGKSTSPYNVICKYNYHFASVDRPTLQNIISPEGFYFIPAAISFDWEKITVELPSLIESVETSENETRLSVNLIICLFEPESEKKNLIDLMGFTNEIPDFDFSKGGGIGIELTDGEKERAGRYQKSILYLALVTKKMDGEICQHSSTYSAAIG